MGTKRRAAEVVQAARGRLKGALQDVINITEDEDEVDKSKLPSRGRPPKRPKKEPTPPPPPPSVHHSFIMKLFDRCVDLAKYNENTPLYPICRAWMINQPRSNQIINYKVKNALESVKRESNEDFLDQIKSGNVIEVTEMPACENFEVPRVPSPLPFQQECCKDNIDLDYDLDDPKISRKELLVDLKGRWSQVRRKWLQHSKMYEEKKYGINMAILDALYKK